MRLKAHKRRCELSGRAGVLLQEQDHEESCVIIFV